MKGKGSLKIIIDVLMTFLLLFLMGYQLWGEEAHEWAGAGMFVLFIAHHVLNRGWHKGLFKGKYTPVRILLTGIDVLLFAAMLAQMYSGILLSRYVFAFLPFDSGMALARRLHILGSYWGFTLMSLHLGLHWNMLLGKIPIKKMLTGKGHGKEQKSSLSNMRPAALFLISLAVAGYGLYAFAERDILTYLFLQTEFVFLDYGESIVLFYLDYICMMGLWIFIAHYGTKLLRKATEKKKRAKKRRESR